MYLLWLLEYSCVRITSWITHVAFINSSHSQHGVLTLIRNDILNFKTIQINNDIDEFKNRLSHIQIQTDEIVNIINIYAPAHTENLIKIRFYQKLKEYLSKYKNELIILTGDFNYVISKEDRIKGYDYYDYIRINKMMNFEDFNLKYVYSTIYLGKTDFTTNKSRIDRIYINETLLTKIFTWGFF